MSFGRTSRGLTYEGMKEAIAFILDGLDTVDEAELELINSVETDRIPRANGKITGAELKKFFADNFLTELELIEVLARFRALQT